MNKWSEIKQATLNKLFLEESEAMQQGYLEKFQYLANECLNSIANRVKPRIAILETDTEDINSVVTMPEDFLSFADIIGYLNNEPDPSVVYLTDKKILLPKKGSYKIIYNALWNDITKDDVEQDNVLEIDKSVLNCLPTYIASQLLSQDDVVRSATLKNEYEMLIAGLDTNLMYETNHYKSTGGWY